MHLKIIGIVILPTLKLFHVAYVISALRAKVSALSNTIAVDPQFKIHLGYKHLIHYEEES